MENKSTSSQLPTALRLGNTVTTDKSMIIENFNKHFSTAGHVFLLATPTPANSSVPPAATCPNLPSFSFAQIQIADVLKELQNLDPYKSAGLDNKSRVGLLFRNKASFTHAAKLTLVKLTILPILDFGDVIYKIASNTQLKLDVVYHSAIRFVTKPPTTATCML